MFDWIFGKKEDKKEQKKQDKKNDNSKISPEDMWMYDCLTQYLSSPLWKIPIVDFLQLNCIYFEDTEENKFEYTKIFQNFRQLVSGMVDNMVKELGISDDLLERCLNKGLRSKQHKLFEQILVVDNFEAFKRIMIKKNKELQLQALMQLQGKSQIKAHPEVQISELELEKMQMQRAIAISMALREKISEEEEKMIQEAIRQSELQEQKRIEAEIAKQQKEEVKKEKEQEPKEKPKKTGLSTLSELPPLTVAKSQPIAQMKKESEQIEQKVTELKKEIKPQNKEDAEQRKKRLIEQRQLLRKKKQEERTEELKQFVEGKNSATANATTGAQKQQSKVSAQEIERRKNLMKRLKEQLE